MKDMHSHIIYGIDDGSRNIEDSLNILKKANSNNITDIVLTPHYIKNTNYNSNAQNNSKLLEKLKLLIHENNLNINLYLGNEIMIDKDIVALLRSGEVASINGTRYVLVEFPMYNFDISIESILFDLLKNGYVPIIAHPERYEYFNSHYDFFERCIEMGAVLQGNYLSLLKVYGKKARNNLIKLLKENKINILASDIHRNPNDYDISKILKKLKKIVRNDTKIKTLLEDNFDKIISNKDIDTF